MGQFSWITQDSNEAIRESYGCDDQGLTTAYMHDDKGNVWSETSYEGYGEFGGKDYYELLAEMSGLQSDRSVGIDLAFGGKPHITPNLTRSKEWTWVNEAPKQDPNQGWGD
jgi:hypothetical protein